MPTGYTDNMVYEIKRDGAWYTVVSKETGMVHYRSLKRINCKDYIAAQQPQEEGESVGTDCN